MNLPNKITMIRIIMVPAFIALQVTNTRAANIAAFVLFIVASSTDWVDGYFARKLNKVTTFGKFVDPLADKLLVSCALIVFTATGEIHPVAVMLIISREFIVTTLRVVAISGNVEISASYSAKVKTVTQIIAICCLLFDRIYVIGIALKASDVYFTLSGLAVFIAVIITIYSGIEYLWRNRQLILSSK